MSIPDEEALLRARDDLVTARVYAQELATALRQVIELPMASIGHRDAVLRGRALLIAYDAEQTKWLGAQEARA